MNVLVKLLYTVCALLISAGISAQVKFEKEYRIRKDTIAESACVFVHKSAFLQEGTGVKWYREESEEGISLEAKFKQDGRRYSVEFSHEGQFQDVEMEVPRDEVDESIIERMESTLDREFSKWKFKKIQRQWSGIEGEVLKALKSGSARSGVEEKFEVVVKGRADREKAYFELLFDAEGTLISKSRIAENPSDILIY